MLRSHLKRPRAVHHDDLDNLDNLDNLDADAALRRKRPRLTRASSTTPDHESTASRANTDRLSLLSDELLVRILSYLSLPHLLAVSPVSRRFHLLAQDSQLWKALYYSRFVLPRAMRIPGFREGKSAAGMMGTRVRGHKLHYKGRSTLWADGRMGGLVRTAEGRGKRKGLEEDVGKQHDRVNWKRQYRIRHNWARGKCAVEELKLGPDPEKVSDTAGGDGDLDDRSKMLVKVVEGLVVTADRAFGLRVWDLKTREVMAQLDLGDHDEDESSSSPSCIAVDERDLEKGALDISIGFMDGSFGVWRLSLSDKMISRRYRHEGSSNGELAGMAYSHPYLLTATGTTILISLYTFDVPEISEGGDGHVKGDTLLDAPSRSSRKTQEGYPGGSPKENTKKDPDSLLAPYLMTSLKSHTSDPPLALSIRKTADATVASIAYTFFTRQGWSIGIQGLHITPNENPKGAPNINTQLAYTTPVSTSGPLQFPLTPPRTPPRPTIPLSSPTASPPSASTTTAHAQAPAPHRHLRNQPGGPTTLCYSHPYLLATLPDNTLTLHLCTSSASKLSISPGIRLWGHTSGISDAEITARGKAVSVSSRGEEMRVWELEGRPSGVRSRSVEIRAGGGRQTGLGEGVMGGGGGGGGGRDRDRDRDDGVGHAGQMVDWEERRSWVGFDDEMVIVLKEARGGRESLLVYDFT